MAEFVLGNKVRDLLVYTMTVTKPKGEKSVEIKDMLPLFEALKNSDTTKAQQAAADAETRLRRCSDKQGFPKSAVHTYIALIRQTAMNITTDVQSANDCNFETDYERRLEFIDKTLQDCNTLLMLIDISLELGYIGIKRCEHWTKLVTDVKYMTLAWKKKDASRADKLRTAKRKTEYEALAEAIAKAISSG